MASVAFHAEYSPSYFGSVNVDVRLRFDESYSSGTNKTTLTLSGIDFRLNGNTATYGLLPIYGTITVAGTQIVAIDNESQSAEVSISGSDWCSADISGLSPSQVTVTHNADGSKSVDVSLTGGYTVGQTRFSAVYEWNRQIGTTPLGHPLYTTMQTLFGIETPVTGTMALTTHTPTYTVSYNANGGSGAPNSQTKTYGVALTLRTGTPTKSNTYPGSYTVTYKINYTGGSDPSSASSTRTVSYTFSKWNTESNGTGTDYNPGGSYTANKAATLYAQWSSTETRAAVTLPSPSRPGHTFNGWYTASSGGTKVGVAGASYTPSGNTTLYAHWTANTYTVSYNKGSNGTGTNTTATKIYDVALTLKGAIFTRTGHTQDGWSKVDGGSKTYNLSASYEENAAVTLYPHWSVNSYTVSYNANGHGSAPASQTANYDSSVSLKSYISNQTGTGTTSNYVLRPNKNGGSGTISNGSATRTPQYTYSQSAWNTESDGAGTSYSAGASYTVIGDRTFYAKWSTATTYAHTCTLPSPNPTKSSTSSSITINFNANGGSTTKTSQSSSRTTTYSFGGWWTAADGGTQVKTSSEITKDQTVYAHYTSSTGSYSTITLPTAAQCTRTGFTLKGFSLSSTATTASRQPGETYTPSSSYSTGYTWYAVWEPNSYTLTKDPGLHGTITVNRTSSPNKGASTGNLSDGATIYYGDKLKITTSCVAGVSISTQTVNYRNNTAEAFTSGDSITVGTQNVTVKVRCTVIAYKLSISQGSGTTISVSRTSSVHGGSIGSLSNNATIYYGDVLTISITANTGYNLGTHTVNGSAFTSGSYTVSGNTSVVSTAQKKTFTLTITSGTRSTATVYRSSSPIGGASTGNLETGATLYYNDVLKVTFSAQAGWHVTTHTVNGSTFTSGNNHTVTANAAVVCYSTANTYAVKFNANQGTATVHGSMSNQEFTYNASQNLTANAFSRSYDLTYYIDGLGITYAVGSTFRGWATSASGSVVYQNGASVKNLTTTNNGTVNLYAKWTNGTTSLPNIPAKRGYTIKGWYTAASGGTKVGNAGDPYTPTANTTIYAQYVKTTYKLTITKSNPGVTLTVHRDSSPIGGGSIANLSNNATLYVDDHLTITYEIAAGYQQDVATINGADFTSPGYITVPEENGNVAVVVTVRIGGTVWIYDGSPDNNGWGLYQVYIYDDDGWSLYQPYIYDDDGWSLY